MEVLISFPRRKTLKVVIAVENHLQKNPGKASTGLKPLYWGDWGGDNSNNSSFENNVIFVRNVIYWQGFKIALII